ncbi:MAG: MBL fold metallo-hydrolase [Pirellulaceae bacterium]
MFKLHFLGAARQVTGSRYCIESNGAKLLVDCGMFQEREFLERNWETSPIPAAEIDALLLTHVHIDHSGLIPKLCREGFRGPIHCTRPSVPLAEVLLRDSAEIQEEDAAYKRRRHQREHRRGPHPEVPLYTERDVEHCLGQFVGHPYQKSVKLNEEMSVTFHDAGHILGSAMLEVLLENGGQRRRLVFSGDIGQWDKPLIRDPSLFEQADYVVMESTYGDRDHEQAGDVETQLADAINATFARGGNVVIPTFAVERSQELVYSISRLVHADRIPDCRVFLDSPMAVDVTDIFRQFQDCLDEETWQLITSGEPPLHFPGLQMVRTAAESRQINKTRDPCVIMSTSGMCTSGRIKHHLRQNLDRPECTILFVGYQAHGTLGRQILDGKPRVRIHGRDYPVRAQVAQIYGFSGHADRSGLLRWIGNLKSPPRRIFLTHGEEDAARSLAAEITRRHGYPVTIPEYQQAAPLE